MFRVTYIFLITCFLLPGCDKTDSQELPKPTQAQLNWQEAELGVLICYELHTFNEGRYNQRLARITPISDANQFNPDNLDTDQWVKASKDAGAKFAILTASHESGFRLWQSDANPFCLSSVNWGDAKRDIVAEFAESCRKYDILPGIYLGTRWNAQLGIYDFKVTDQSSITQEEYNQLIEKEVEEICTNYGDWFEFWFDGGAHGPDQGGPDILSIVQKHQPNALFYHNLDRADARWGGSESGTVSYPCWATFPYISTGAGESAKEAINANGFQLLKEGDPNGTYWMPAMSDAPLRGYKGHEWFWEPGDENLIYPLEKLVDMYTKSVGRNSTLILGITPDTTGNIPKPDVNRLKEFGNEIQKKFGAIISEAGNFLPLQIKIPDETKITTIIIQEDIEYGERVRKYIIKGLKEGLWIQLSEGSCIGHKRIEIIDPIEVSKIKLEIVESTAKPKIKFIGVY